MSAVATAPDRVAAGLRAGDAHRLRFDRIVRAEGIKLLSLRSTYWTSGIIILLWLAFALLMASTASTPIDFATGEALPVDDDWRAYMTVLPATGAVMIGTLVAAIQGVLSISGEYGTGMIRSSFAAVPRRLPVLAAKAIVIVLWTMLVGVIATAASLGLALAFLLPEDLAAPLSAELILPFAGAVLYLGLVALFGLGIGAAVRSAAAGIAISIGVMLVLPTVLGLLGSVVEWIGEVVPYLMSSAGGALTSIAGNPWFSDSPYSWIAALGIVSGWAAAAIAVGAVVVATRDA